MKYFFIVIMLGCLYSCDCGNKVGTATVADTPKEPKDSVPACVRKLIEESQKDLPPNPPEQIDEYLYKGKKVFLFTAGCCDQFNTVYDDSCKMLCAPSGGITGRGDGNCIDFDKMATHKKLIWQRSSK